MWTKMKLDRLGPGYTDSPLTRFTTLFGNIEEEKVICDKWQQTHDTGHKIYHTWHVTPDSWQMGGGEPSPFFLAP